VERLVAMLRKLEARGTRDGLRLARFVGVGCPGVVLP
jgi:hypothetical protein